MTIGNMSQFIKSLPVSTSQQANPVYCTMLGIKHRFFDDIVQYEKSIGNPVPVQASTIMMLSNSMGPSNTYGKFESYRKGSKYNDDVLHQCLDFTFTNKYKGVIDFNDQSVVSGYNINAIKMVFKLSTENALVTVNNMMSYLGVLVPIPYDTCEYSRISPKAMDYLLSLGQPSPSAVKAFLEYCEERCKVCQCENFEEMISFTLNGKANVIYYGYRSGGMYGFRYANGETENDMVWMVSSDYKPDDDTYYEDIGVEDVNRKFDIRALVVNLWAARTTKAFYSESEPANTRSYMAAMCSTAKPKFNTYRYVHITPEGERMYDESQKVISSVKNDAEYRKSIWFSRAYYARRGTDKVITFCKASIHHRKCAPVVEEAPTVTVYT